MTSLHNRAVLSGIAWAIFTVLIGSLALLTYLNALTYRRFDAELLNRHTQLIAAVANSGDQKNAIASALPDPAYSQPYSGRYWQVRREGGQSVGSRSLFDVFLPVPLVASNSSVIWEGEGPKGQIRAMSQNIKLDGETVWTVSVAENLEALNAELGEVRRNVVLSLGFLGALGTLGALLLTTMILRPIRKLRSDVARRWDAGAELDPEDYPEEVVPLVTDINILIDRNRCVVDQARRHAADIAHALKTPTAVLRNEIEAVPEDRDLGRALTALDRIDDQITRSIARMRTANNAVSSAAPQKISESIDRLVRLFTVMPNSEHIKVSTDVENDLTVSIDRQDLEEIIGNLLENSHKWARSQIVLKGWQYGQDVWISIEDDGPGIPEGRFGEALRSGGRLDTAVPGTGLGLAIADGLVKSYSGALELGRSQELGGLAALLQLPVKFSPT